MAVENLIKDIENELEKVKDDVKDLEWRMRSLHDKAITLEKTLNKMQADTIPKVEYDLVKKIVFGAVGVIILAVFTALVGLVIVK